MPAHPINWLIGQKACGCATVTLICFKPVEPKPEGVANKPGRNWIYCPGMIKRFQDAGVTRSTRLRSSTPRPTHARTRRSGTLDRPPPSCWPARPPPSDDTRSPRASEYTRAQLVAPPVPPRSAPLSYPLPPIAKSMPATDGADETNSEKPFWDSSQLTQRAWIDDLLPWIPTCNASYASLIEHGYTLSPQRRVVLHSYQHAQAVFSNLYTPYPLDAPSPITPVFNFAAAPTAAAPAGPATQSTPASAAPTSATPASQPVATGLPSVTTVRNLTADERNHFVISPEQLAGSRLPTDVIYPEYNRLASHARRLPCPMPE
eukprot:2895503-Pleurochrysis_carterae.AAC.1